LSAEKTSAPPSTPQSPEGQDKDVREELDQDLVTHQGDYRKHSSPTPPAQRSKHLGASEDEVVPIIPPMAGPADLLGEKDPNAQGNERGDTEVGDEMLDPREELTPG
jgi:hypothetical protein